MDTKQKLNDLLENMLEDGNKREQLYDYEGDSEEGDMFFHIDNYKYVLTRFWYTMGGPNIYVDVTSDRDGFVQSMIAVAAWGFDRKEWTLHENDQLYQLIEQELRF